jgi:peptidoglycan/LPS O-acetylase OafA/YrhL
MTRYRPEIDGLRALAVVPVILFHAGFSAFSGGYVGVDVFFVISGYLITSLLLTEHHEGTFSLIRFYERRARRILPALFSMMAVCLPVAWLLLLPDDMKDFCESLAAVAVFASNVVFSRQNGYFDTASELKPLLHTWSLGVEEQYYVLFPLLLIVLKRLGRGWIGPALAVVGAASFSAAVVRVQEPSAIYLLTTRGWELIIGALLAADTGSRLLTLRRELKQAASAIGVALVLYAVFSFDQHTPFPGAYALIPTLGTALILVSATRDTAVGLALATAPAVGLGLISYSAYLWHQPIFAFGRHAVPQGMDTPALIGLVLLSFAVAYLSWRFIEQPFRRPGTVSQRQVFTLAAIGSLAFGLVGVTGARTDGFASMYVNSRLSPSEVEFYGLIQAHTSGNLYDDMLDDGACHFSAETVTAEFEQRFMTCRSRFGPALVVLGDSHAMNIYNIVARTGVSPFVVGVVQAGCRPHRNDANCQYDGFDQFATHHREDIRTVIYHQSGSYLLRDTDGNVDSPKAFERYAPFIVDEENLVGIVAYLTRLRQLVDTVWLGPYAEGRLNFRDRAVLRRGPFMSDVSLSQFGKLERELQRHMASDAWTFRYVSLHDLLGMQRDFMKDGSCLTFRDTDHFSICGETLVAGRLREAFAQGLFRSRP